MAGTNNVYPWLCIRTVSFGMVFMLSSTEIRSTLDELSVNESPYDNPVEHYQIAKEEAIFKRKKYKCSVCNTFDHMLINCPKCHLVITEEDLFSHLKATESRKFHKRKRVSSQKIRSTLPIIQILVLPVILRRNLLRKEKGSSLFLA